MFCPWTPLLWIQNKVVAYLYEHSCVCLPACMHAYIYLCASFYCTFLMSSNVWISGERPPCTQRNCWFIRAARGRQSNASIQESYTCSEYLILPRGGRRSGEICFRTLAKTLLSGWQVAVPTRPQSTSASRICYRAENKQGAKVFAQTRVVPPQAQFGSHQGLMQPLWDFFIFKLWCCVLLSITIWTLICHSVTSQRMFPSEKKNAANDSR